MQCNAYKHMHGQLTGLHASLVFKFLQCGKVARLSDKPDGGIWCPSADEASLFSSVWVFLLTIVFSGSDLSTCGLKFKQVASHYIS